MAAEFGLDPKVAEDPAFVRFFSGDVAAAREAGIPLQPWATPYAVSVFGQAIASPDPGGGNAYGDGRAVSLGEFMGARRRTAPQARPASRASVGSSS